MSRRASEKETPKLRDLSATALYGKMFAALRAADRDDYTERGRLAKQQFAESCWRELVRRGAANVGEGVG